MTAVTATEPTTAVPPGQVERWHDLDALRGVAMLLGIVLHATMSFFVGFWVVEDVTADDDGYFDELFHAIHGFRMPLFFLLSGFFTTMLWRRRGLGRLLRHRARRIALPLAIGMVTIVPVTNWSIEWAIDNGVSDYVEESGDIWGAVFFGDARAVDALLDRGVDVGAADPESGDTPLHVAAFVGDADIAALLLDRGADPDARSPGGTPLEYAIYVGSPEVADLLVARGVADPRPAGAAWETVSYWSDGAAAAEQVEAKFALESWLTSFHHLWFLWFLLWLVAGFAIVAFVADRRSTALASSGRRGSAVRWVPVVLVALVVGSFATQLLMGEQGRRRTFGPDTSTGLVPEWHVLAYYACFFAFGAVVFGRVGRDGRPVLVRIDRAGLVVAPVAFLLVLPVAMYVTLHTETSWAVASLLQITYAWLAIIGAMGVFHALLPTERRGVRYLSDSAYWLYLAHLPLVIVAQSAIRNWDLPATVKFTGLSVGVTLVLLLTYQLFVRYSPIGTLLNGRRERPTRPPIVGAGRSEPEPEGDVMTDDHDDIAIRVDGLEKRFGDRSAVAGIDLAVRHGELLALLGPNGAGKTTTIRMLCCLLSPTSGTASVMGHDIRDDPLAVKQVIGVSPQETAIAPNLTAWENLALIAGLHGMDRDAARRRAEELVEVTGLGERAGERAKRYSGGMQRRLSIAMALVSAPRVVFLDEPTIGLDPQARRRMWEYIASLKGDTTIVLTTHYLEEADALADRIAVIDAGALVAVGTPSELKAGVASAPVMFVEAPDVGDDAFTALRDRFPTARRVDGGVEIEGERLSVYEIGDCLRPFGVEIRSTSIARVSLDDVFLQLTGKELRS